MRFELEADSADKPGWELRETTPFIGDVADANKSGLSQRNLKQNIRISSSDADELFFLITRAQRTISGFEKIAGKLRIDFCDTAILLACGIINLGASTRSTILIQFANQSSIADYLRMSRETVRRRLVRLEEKKVVSRFPAGYVVSDLDLWLRMIRPFV